MVTPQVTPASISQPFSAAHLLHAAPLGNALHRAKNLLPADLHMILHVREHGGFHVVALVTLALATTPVRKARPAK